MLGFYNSLQEARLVNPSASLVEVEYGVAAYGTETEARRQQAAGGGILHSEKWAYPVSVVEEEISR